MILRFGTRGSRLAVAQSNQVADALRARGLDVELVIIRTSGDRLADVALADFGGKALFVKEIEEALLDGRVDAGVHSLKDMPALLPDGFVPRRLSASRGPARRAPHPRGRRPRRPAARGARWRPRACAAAPCSSRGAPI